MDLPYLLNMDFNNLFGKLHNSSAVPIKYHTKEYDYFIKLSINDDLIRVNMKCFNKYIIVDPKSE